tara:strand:+ start:878 stop:1375 length:498 start_codon:yes stop_codon:yes gene_type:complete
MAQITLKGNSINTIAELPKIGEKSKDFSLVQNNLSSVSLKDFEGVRLVLNIFPSIDTGTCAASVKAFNKSAVDLKNTKVLCVSRDLPFAQARFCGAEGIENAITVSDFVAGQFGKDYGLTIENGPLAHLHSRCVIVLDEKHHVIYTEQVGDIVDEPNYDAALAVL